jgi:hypothetical protein
MCLQGATGIPGTGKYSPGGSGSIAGVNVGDPLDLFGGQRRRDAASAEARARADEEARQAGITKNINDINAAYAGREGQYADLGAALRGQLGTDLKRQQADATRKAKFALARTGNTGGSVATDVGRNLSREAAQGALDAERKARGGVENLRSQDEASRLSLIGMAQNGGNIGNAAEQSARLLASNLGAAQNNATVGGLGDVFAGVSNYYRQQQDRADTLRGIRSVNPYGAPQTSGFVGPR